MAWFLTLGFVWGYQSIAFVINILIIVINNCIFIYIYIQCMYWRFYRVYIKNVCMYVCNRGIISSQIDGKMLNFGLEVLFILFFLNITTKWVVSQIQNFVTSSLRYSMLKHFRICSSTWYCESFIEGWDAGL